MPINLVKTSSRNYAEVQAQILGLIKAELPPGSFLESVESRREEFLNFSLFIHQPTDVLLSHGLADKNYFFRKDENGQRIASRLAHVFVPGNWLRERLLASSRLGLAAERVHVVGWPRLDELLSRQARQDASESPARRKRVLWAPTHDFARRGEDEVSLSSYPEFEPSIEKLEAHFDVAVSLHPRNRRDKVPTVDKLLWADYVISDFGTMVYEAWALGKPVLFPDWLIRDRILEFLPRGSAERVIFQQGIGLHAESFDELCDFIRTGAVIDARTQAFMDSYLAREYHGTSARRVANLLLELAATS
jgi:hypothetical protein